MQPQEQDTIRTDKGTFNRGHSGNPGGRPKGLSFEAVIREFLEEVDENTRKQRKIEIVRAMYEAVRDNGNVPAAVWLADRGYGKVKEVHDVNQKITTVTQLIEQLTGDAYGSAEEEATS